MTCVVVFNYYHLRVFVPLLDSRAEGFGKESKSCWNWTSRDNMLAFNISARRGLLTFNETCCLMWTLHVNDLTFTSKDEGGQDWVSTFVRVTSCLQGQNPGVFDRSVFVDVKQGVSSNNSGHLWLFLHQPKVIFYDETCFFFCYPYMSGHKHSRTHSYSMKERKVSTCRWFCRDKHSHSSQTDRNV